MLQTVSISSKRQITIPAKIFNKLGLAEGERLIIVIENNRIVMQKAQSLLDEVAGSVKVPKYYKNKSLDLIISEAKNEYFARKK